jgi:hypothetical protein
MWVENLLKIFRLKFLELFDASQFDIFVEIPENLPKKIDQNIRSTL